ncbi:hypothetical protein ACFWPA_16420 [Rhodococcus sp. NPDC058505]|uniref:hypothetical protein n=1 Tax=unclassified Rhodococcus (in: high G+C Gram-positive bacteria) TaxID=192944 RepID=UPI003651F2B7
MTVRVAPSTQPRGVEASGAPVGTAARLRTLARTTPARMTALGIGLVLLAIVSGTVAATQVMDRQRTLDVLHTEIEPLAYAAQDIYSSLSIADAAATTAFLSGGIEPVDVRDRYTRAITDAGVDLVDAAAGTDPTDTTAHDLLTKLSVGVPVYTGLIETARANHRDGHPVGSAYLSEASTMLQTTLLPLAEQLHTVQAARVVALQAEFATPPWLAIALLMLLLAALVVASYLLARWTRRRLNAGLILACLAVTVSLGWLVVAGFVSASSTARALDLGARPLAELTTARILTQQARADETLGLVRRDFTGRYDADFQRHLDRLGSVLADIERRDPPVAARIGAADRARVAWSSAHAQLMTHLAEGNWRGAVTIAIAAGGAGSTAHYAAADTELTSAIAATRAELRDGIGRALTTLTGLAPGTAGLGVIAVTGVVIGLWPRLREYQ